MRDHSSSKQNRDTRIARAVSILLALCLWELGARLLGKPILLVGPIEVLGRLLSLMGDAGFFASISFSFSRIIGGFFLAAAIGILLGIAAGHLPVLETFLWPYFSVMKAVPVASFVVLCLIWFRPKNLSVFISMVMVMPILYFNVLEGIRSVPKDLIEMSRSFRFSAISRFTLVELPALEPFLLSALKTSLGVAWKAGIAAEIIGIPDGSIGERLYEAKIYLETGDLFAWTLVILCMSMLFEKAVLLAVRVLLANYRKDSADLRETAAGSGEKSAISVALIPAGHPITVVLKSVTAGYEEHPNSPVLSDLTMAFPAGSITAVMGESGTGKTTLLRVIAGLLPPSAGEVMTGEKETPSFGIVFQEDRLCESFSPVNNIEAALPRAARSGLFGTGLFGTGVFGLGSFTRRRALRRYIENELASIGIAGDAMHSPAAACSGGMKRRCAIVRAMLSEGEVILLDEPFTGLDAESKRIAAEYIQRRRDGRTVVMVTHSEEEAELLGARIVRL